MSQENIEFMRRSVGGSMRDRAAVLAAALVASACLLCVGLPARASAATAFREVTVDGDAQLLTSDGVRFVTLLVRLQGDQGDTLTVPWVFDTLARRRFRPTRPSPDCHSSNVGGDVALWRCADSRYMVTDLATGAARELPGWAAVEAMKSSVFPEHCDAHRVGRYWLEGTCGGSGVGQTSDPFFLNHRTGRLMTRSAAGFDPYDPDINLDYRDLVTPRCAPVRQSWLRISLPPFTLQALRWSTGEYTYDGFAYGEIRLRRCGDQRAQIVSRCPANNCAAVQLGSLYVTWAEGNRVFAYLPRARRRVLVAPAPAGSSIWEHPVNVVHACDRVYAQWPDALYVARFEPRRGAPPCQTRSRTDTARTSNTKGEPKASFLEAVGLRDR
jgi:hypothetical protein